MTKAPISWTARDAERHFEPLGTCRDVDEFEKLNRIGEGTYGTVYRARDRQSKRIVALKRVILHNEASEGVRMHSESLSQSLRVHCALVGLICVCVYALVPDHCAARDQVAQAAAAPQLCAALGRRRWPQTLQVRSRLLSAALRAYVSINARLY
jgi:hypothetical protein